LEAFAHYASGIVASALPLTLNDSRHRLHGPLGAITEHPGRRNFV
jgi:hypothetical protein